MILPLFLTVPLSMAAAWAALAVWDGPPAPFEKHPFTTALIASTVFTVADRLGRTVSATVALKAAPLAARASGLAAEFLLVVFGTFVLMGDLRRAFFLAVALAVLTEVLAVALLWMERRWPPPDEESSRPGEA